MLPVIAIVGRPNVGKSTLFNRLTRSRAALVADQPGLTRDRHYGSAEIDGRTVVLVDTGGIGEAESGIDVAMEQQTRLALEEADLVVFVLDARSGLTAGDEVVATELRRSHKPVLLVVNKSDGVDIDQALAEFHGLGFGEPNPVSATHGHGLAGLAETCAGLLPGRESFVEAAAEAAAGIRIAVVGRPNVGKSTLVNRMLGEDRVVVFDQPGTTRDSIYIPFRRQDQEYVLIDTAGVRRRGRVTDAVEKFSVIKTIQAINDAHVVVLVCDAAEGVVEQDLHLAAECLEAGRALVVAFNKWDGLDTDQRGQVRRDIDRRLRFVDFAPMHFISALHGTGVSKLYGAVSKAWASANGDWPTHRLTEILHQAVQAHEPPLSHGRRIKLRYAHQGGSCPPVIVIHGNQTSRVPASYQRYLENTYRRALDLIGTPLRIEFKTGKNPYAGRRNPLTERQLKRKKRLMRHVKKR